MYFSILTDTTLTFTYWFQFRFNYNIIFYLVFKDLFRIFTIRVHTP